MCLRYVAKEKIFCTRWCFKQLKINTEFRNILLSIPLQENKQTKKPKQILSSEISVEIDFFFPILIQLLHQEIKTAKPETEKPAVPDADGLMERGEAHSV